MHEANQNNNNLTNNGAPNNTETSTAAPKGGLQVKPMKFTPDYFIGHIKTGDILNHLGQTLSGQLDGYQACNIAIVDKEKGKISVKIALRLNSKELIVSALAKFGSSNAYTLTDSAKSKLAIFKLNPNEPLRTKVLDKGNGLLTIDLDFLAVFANLMQKPNPGFIYTYSIVKRFNDATGVIRIEMKKNMKKHGGKKHNGNKNHDTNHNNSHNTTW